MIEGCDGCKTAAGQSGCLTHGTAPNAGAEIERLRSLLTELRKEYALLVKDRDDWRGIAQGGKAGKRISELEKRVALEVEQGAGQIELMRGLKEEAERKLSEVESYAVERCAKVLDDEAAVARKFYTEALDAADGDKQRHWSNILTWAEENAAKIRKSAKNRTEKP